MAMRHLTVSWTSHERHEAEGMRVKILYGEHTPHQHVIVDRSILSPCIGR